MSDEPRPDQQGQGLAEELEVERARGAAVQRAAHLGSWETDMVTLAVSWSEETHRIFETDPATFRPTHSLFLERVHPLDRDAVEEAFQGSRAQRAPCSIEHRLLLPGGRVKVVEERWLVTSDERGKPLRAFGTCQDITERRRADDALRQSQALLRIAGKTARLGGWMIELPGRELTWSDEICAIHDLPPGYRPTLEEGLGYFPPEYRELVLRHLHACETEGVPYDLELQKLTATGRRIWVRSIGEAVRDAEGRIVRLQGAFQDISELKQAELGLKQRDALLDQATDAIFVQDLEARRITSWNRGAERLYGWTREEAIGGPVSRLVTDAKTTEEAARQVLAGGEWSGELQTVNKAGGVLTVVARWTLLRDEHGLPRAVLVINTDVTEKKKLEAQFFRAQRMESIGTLAGGIAHDLNNMLAPIMMAVDYLREQVHAPQVQDTLNTLETSAQRAADLVKQVLAFARGVEGKRVHVIPLDVLRDVELIAQDTFPKNIRLELEARGAWPVLGDPTQLRQVFTNLCVNARDAMPGGGVISITSDNLVLPQAFAGAPPEAKPGRWLRVRVKDTGTGIASELRERIFEPFFTTKEVGKGTGLGLSTTQAIVRSHGGFIHLSSEPGQPTTFEVYLPAHVGEGVDDAPPPPARGQLPRGNRELVLVVDDEPALRRVAKRILESYGYRVLLAVDGADAMEVFTRHHQEIDVVLTDMAMPVMDGPSLIRGLRSVAPRVRVIGSSGFAPDVSSTGAAAHFVHKPYSAHSLLEALRLVLAP